MPPNSQKLENMIAYKSFVLFIIKKMLHQLEIYKLYLSIYELQNTVCIKTVLNV